MIKTSRVHKSKYSRMGISDIVGNIILLAITVMMFSGILVYTMNLPAPETETHVRFNASLVLTEDGKANITITHTGGEKLNVQNVRISIFIDGTLESIRLSSSPGWAGVQYWSTGAIWNYKTSANVLISSIVSVSVIEDIDNKVLFSSTILGGGANLPPMVLKIYSTPEPVLIGKNFQFFAIVWDPDGNLDTSSVVINVTNLYNDGIVRLAPMYRVKGDLYATNATNLATSLSLPFDKALKGEKSVKVNATDRLGLGSVVPVSIIIGEESELIGVADPTIGPLDIAFSNPSPTQGDVVTIFAKVTNNGTMSTNVTVRFSVEVSGITTVLGNGTDIFGNTTQFVRGNFDIKIFQIAWHTKSAGMHNVSAEVFVNTSMPGSALDTNLTNNIGMRAIGVMPRILIVDDDQNIGDGSARDTAGYMKAALTACGFKWELATVRLGMDGPLLSTGDHKLEDYGIVVWMCGYQSTGTLTPTDRQTLQDYLANRDSSLWLIGQDVLDDLSLTGGTTFYKNTLHVSSFVPDVGTPVKINGTPGHFLGNGLSYNSRPIPDPADHADVIVPDSNALGFLQNSSMPTPNNCSLTYEDTTKNSKVCFFSFEFSRLQRLDDMAQLAYRIILWLGNLQSRYGNDLAVSEQNIDEQYPFYSDIIEINATIRNNGDEDIPNANIPYIRVQFILDDSEIIGEVLITDVLPKGGTALSSKSVNVSWKADRLGHHKIVAVVDPLMEIDEVNEDNNRATVDFADIDVYVRFNVLVIDDDRSSNNDGNPTNTNMNVTSNLTSTLESLNYDYATFTVNATSNWNGPSIDEMQQFNLLIWCTGEDTVGTITSYDKTNLSKYLENRGQLWLIGQNILDELSPANGEVTDEFFRDYLKVTGVTHPATPSDTRLIEGIQGDPVTHGMLCMLEKPIQFASSEGADGLAVDSSHGAVGIFSSADVAKPEFQSGFEEGLSLWDNSYEGVTGWPPISHPPVGRLYVSEEAAHGGKKGVKIEAVDVSSLNVSSFLVKDVDVSHGYVRAYFKWDANPADGQMIRLIRLQGDAYWAAGHVATAALENAGGTLRAALIYRSNDGTPDSKLTQNFAFQANKWYCIELYAKIGDGTSGAVAMYIDGTQVIFAQNIDNNNIGGIGHIKHVYIGAMGVSFVMNMSLDDVKMGRDGPMGPDSFYGVRYADPVFGYKAMFFPWELSFLASPLNESLRELVYMAMHWFGTPDLRVELRITRDDIFYSTSNVTMAPIGQLVPTIGTTYILQARIWNVGGSRGDAVVRFMDGPGVIGSPTVSVAPDMSAIAETVWTPMRAGDRLLSILIDPMDNLPEISDIESSQGEVFNFNNNITGRVRLYFFYDDMEAGTSNWRHDATLLNINGEGGIDFLGPGEANTNIIMNWEETKGIAVSKTMYHSANTSYVMNLNQVNDYLYEFYLPYDQWAGWQGAYMVGVMNDAKYMVTRWDSGLLDWVVEETGSIGLGKLKMVKGGASLPYGTVYRVYSNGPLLIVITSKEGSNVNIANYENGTGVGERFVALGDYQGKLTESNGPGSRIVVFGTEASTTVYCNFTNLLTYSLISSQSQAVGAGGYATFTRKEASTSVVTNISSNKPIIAYRISGDNDELDTAMSTSGSSLGTKHFFPLARNTADGGSLIGRAVYTNPGDVEATVSLTEITTNPVPVGWGTITTTVPAHQTVTVRFNAGNDNWGTYRIRCYKVESTQPITVLYGEEIAQQGTIPEFNSSFDGYSDSDNNGVTDFCVDAIWEWLPTRAQQGAYVYKVPLVYGKNAAGHPLSNSYQHMIAAYPTVTDISPPLAFLSSTTTANTFRYMSTVDCTLKLRIEGTPTIQWKLDTNSLQPLTGNAISLPMGGHSVYLTLAGTGYVGISGIDFSSNGSIAWNVGTIARDSSSVDHAKTQLIDPAPFWTVSADKRILFLVGGDGNCWIHTILPFEGQVSTGEVIARGRGLASDDNYAITDTFSLKGYSSAELSFYQKYNIQLGANGIVVLVGNDTNGDNVYKYRYVTPRQAYTGNIKYEVSGVRIQDSYGNEMRWCYNGVSSNGRYDWDYISVDLSPFIGNEHVRVKFLYLNVTNTIPGKWFVDDIIIRASRSDAASVDAATSDGWELCDDDAFSGSYSWWCHDAPSSNGLKSGVDNSLYTRPIDLTSARDARLEAMVKFNINYLAGRPPDSLRIEISSDMGVTWQALTLGVRACWNVSGTEPDGSDGRIDGKSYTGLTADPERPGWVTAGSLTRLSCDLSGWAGKVILLRFRIVTNSEEVNYEDPNAPMGVYIDDVAIVGNSSSGREMQDEWIPMMTSDPYPSAPPLQSQSSECNMNLEMPSNAFALDVCAFMGIPSMPCSPSMFSFFGYLAEWYEYLQELGGVET